MDVKYEPNACYFGKDEQKFYQYTVIEEAFRKRFLYAHEEISSFSTVDFFQMRYLVFRLRSKGTANG